MIPDVETFYINQTTTDRFGKIISTESPLSFTGMSDEETRYDQKDGSLNIVGKGTVFTNNSDIDFIEGMEIQVNGDWYVITKKYRAKHLGQFHHWELVYG
jgi:hypothetical protein